MSPFLTQLLFMKTPCMETHCSDVFLTHGILFQEVLHDMWLVGTYCKLLLHLSCTFLYWSHLERICNVCRLLVFEF